MRVGRASGIDEIILTGSTPDGAFVVDDLTYKDL